MVRNDSIKRAKEAANLAQDGQVPWEHSDKIPTWCNPIQYTYSPSGIDMPSKKEFIDSIGGIEDERTRADILMEAKVDEKPLERSNPYADRNKIVTEMENMEQDNEFMKVKNESLGLTLEQLRLEALLHAQKKPEEAVSNNTIATNSTKSSGSESDHNSIQTEASSIFSDRSGNGRGESYPDPRSRPRRIFVPHRHRYPTTGRAFEGNLAGKPGRYPSKGPTFYENFVGHEYLDTPYPDRRFEDSHKIEECEDDVSHGRCHHSRRNIVVHELQDLLGQIKCMCSANDSDDELDQRGTLMAIQIKCGEAELKDKDDSRAFIGRLIDARAHVVMTEAGSISRGRSRTSRVPGVDECRK